MSFHAHKPTQENIPRQEIILEIYIQTGDLFYQWLATFNKDMLIYDTNSSK